MIDLLPTNPKHPSLRSVRINSRDIEIIISLPVISIFVPFQVIFLCFRSTFCDAEMKHMVRCPNMTSKSILPFFYLYRRLLLAHCETSSFMLGAATEVVFAVAAFSSSFSGPPVRVRTGRLLS